MAFYRYRVCDDKGNTFEKSIEGESVHAARRSLQQQQLTIIALIDEGETPPVKDTSLKTNFSFSASSLKLINFTEQLAPLVAAGIELEAALEIIEEELDDNSHAKNTVHELRQGLHEGRRFSQLLQSRSHIFPPFYAQIVAVGEDSGQLSLSLNELLAHLKQTQQIRNQMLTASIYPGIISLVSLSAILFLLGNVVPRFAEIFTRNKKEPQFITAVLFDISSFVQNYWWGILIAPIILLILIRTLKRSQKNSIFIDSLLLKVPLISPLVKIANLLTFLKTTQIMLSSGVHLLHAVQSAANLLPNSKIRQSLNHVCAQLRRGEKLSATLKQSPFFPPSSLRMIAIGEQTGEMDKMLQQIAEQYEEKLQRRIKILLNAFEPILIIVLGGIIGFIVLAMFLSISQMTQITP